MGTIDSIVFIKGTNKHPIITKVYKFKTLQQIDRESIANEVTEYEQRGYDNANEIIEAYAGHSVFGRYTIQDCMSYRQYKRQGSRPTGSKDSGERNIGATSLKTNSRTLADFSESAFSMPENVKQNLSPDSEGVTENANGEPVAHSVGDATGGGRAQCLRLKCARVQEKFSELKKHRKCDAFFNGVKTA